MKDKIISVLVKVRDFILDHKKLSIIVGTFLVLIIVWNTVSIFRTYTDYTVKNDIKSEDSDGTAYESFHDNIVKYNSDGAFYMSSDGDLIWNESFDMSSPAIDICEDYLAIYDRGGTKIYVMNATGRKGLITTTKPITRACIADEGEVAVLMTGEDTSYLELRDIEGEVLADGVMHAKNSGYPVDIALSSNGKKLAVSSVDLNSGSVQTTITFYDFGSAGQKEKDNIVGNYSFSDMVMPKLQYMSNDKLIAFGDHEIAVFSASKSPKLSKEIFPQGNIDSIFYNEEHFGYIGPETDNDGETHKRLYVFGESGWKKLEKVIDDSFTTVDMLDNDDVVLIADNKAVIHTIHGIKRFDHTFDSSIYKIIPDGGRKDYIFIENGVAEAVRLK